MIENSKIASLTPVLRHGASCNGTDNNGNLRKQTVYVPNNDGNTSSTSWYQTYGYDALNRVSQVHEYTGNTSYDWQQAYTYDRYGNRSINNNGSATWGDGINSTQAAIDTSTNHLYATNDSSHTLVDYDAAGNQTKDYLTSNGTRVYNAENRMTSATDSNSHTSTYTYDGEGKRVKRNVTGTETWQVYGLGGELMAEYAANAGASSPQKEYGYRNGQLLITVEAANTAAPSTLAAVPSGTTSSPTVTVSWTAASGATNYRVERKGAGGSYSLVTTTSSTSLTDSGVTSGHAYLYKVCAADGQGACTSSYGNIALGTAIIFATDPTIYSYTENPSNATTMKAAHITELRTAVDAVRSLAGQSAATWTHLSISVGDTIYKEDVQNLRDRLNDALVALSIQTSDYDDQTLAGAPNGTLIKAVHIRQLRTRATQGTGGSGSGGTTLGVHWMVTDQLGTPRMVFDQSGSLANVSRHDYLPFGEELGANIGNRTIGQGYSANDNERKKFTGYERDTETGLDFAQARYYGNTQGRFTSPDPFSGSAILADPQTFNRYVYCRNNPVNSTDPTGMAPGAMAMPSGERVNAAQGMIDQVREIIAQDEARFEKYVNDASSGLRDNTSVTVAITEDSSKDDSSGADEGKGGDPQNSTDDFSAGLRTRLTTLFAQNKQCEGFLNAVLTQLHTTTPDLDLRANTFRGVFDDIAKQGGYYDASGQTGDLGKTRVTPTQTRVGINLSLAKPGGADSIEATIIHETTHGATKHGGGFSEFEIADAAWVVGRKMGVVPDGIGRGIDKKTDAAYKYNRKLFDSTVGAVCGPYPKQ